jgi:hypothetical protein
MTNDQPDLFPVRTARKCPTCGVLLRETESMYLCLVCDFRRSKPKAKADDGESEG